MRGDISLLNVFFASDRTNVLLDGFSANRLRVDKVRTAGCFSVQPLLRLTKGVTGVTQ